jgi:hypothetical protein
VSTQSRNQPVIPTPIFGILAPGEERTRKFPVLSQGIMPMVQNFPGGQVALVSMGPDFVTIENRGDGNGAFTILFVTQSQVQKLMLAKQVMGMVAELKKK